MANVEPVPETIPSSLPPTSTRSIMSPPNGQDIVMLADGDSGVQTTMRGPCKLTEAHTQSAVDDAATGEN